MANPSIKNRVGMTVTGTPGTGTITLNAADTGYQSFATAYGANANVDILISEGTDGATGWEIARDCTYTHSGTTVTRGTLEASSTGSAVSFTSAAKVYVVNSAYRINNLVNPGVVRVTSDGSTTQTITASTFTKITTALATESIDQNGWWDGTNKKFVPTVAGKYMVSAVMGLVAIDNGKTVILALYKNGSIHTMLARGYSSVTNAVMVVSGSAIIDMNGSTDYCEMYGYHNNTSVSNYTSPESERVVFQAYRIGD